jgi:hypothetical protein
MLAAQTDIGRLRAVFFARHPGIDFVLKCVVRRGWFSSLQTPSHMKYCPECGERFDEEIIKFCTRDGTPLVEEEGPRFTAMPSQSGEDAGRDPGEETVIRRKPFETSGPAGPERFVIPTSEPASQKVRPRPAQAYYPPPPPPPNTGKVVVLTILGTIFVLACGAGLFWLLQGPEPANLNANNINTNMPNINLNTNLGFDSNFNFNAVNINTNFNIPNINVNLRSPLPSPSPRPSLSPLPSTSPSPATSPTPRPTANRASPRPPAVNRPTNGT